jgi:uncharacterized protein (UPF0332 family)
MDGSDFLDVAWHLLEGESEAAWRSAVSRAYYAAFHVARELMIRNGFVVQGGEAAHAYLWRRLSNGGNREVQTAGNRLNLLRGVRNQADYQLDASFSQALADAQVQTAQDIVDLLEALNEEPEILASVIESMRTYERDVLREPTYRL